MSGTNRWGDLRLLTRVRRQAARVQARALVGAAARLGLPVGWVPEWSLGLYEGPSPLELRPAAGVKQPVLSAAAAADLPARFLADPFLVRSGDEWLLFMEVMHRGTGRGAIGLARSGDARTWRYAGLVLEEPFHQSYPCVFEADGSWYMTPSGRLGGGVRLYRAAAFPHGWRFVRELVRGPYNDPTVFFHQGRWWMFAGIGMDTLCLFSADHPEGEWTEHPASPLRRGDARNSRPGGRVVRHGERLIRFAQDDEELYGHAVRAFEITCLTPTAYRELPVTDGPTLGPGAGWNACGMHHVDACRTEDGRWLAVVDGWRMRPTWRPRG